MPNLALSASSSGPRSSLSRPHLHRVPICSALSLSICPASQGCTGQLTSPVSTLFYHSIRRPSFRRSTVTLTLSLSLFEGVPDSLFAVVSPSLSRVHFLSGGAKRILPFSDSPHSQQHGRGRLLPIVPKARAAEERSGVEPRGKRGWSGGNSLWEDPNDQGLSPLSPSCSLKSPPCHPPLIFFISSSFFSVSLALSPFPSLPPDSSIHPSSGCLHFAFLSAPLRTPTGS